MSGQESYEAVRRVRAALYLIVCALGSVRCIHHAREIWWGGKKSLHMILFWHTKSLDDSTHFVPRAGMR